MTTLLATPTPSPPPVQLSAVAGAATSTPSGEMRQLHSDDRWSRWALKAASQNFVSHRRFQIIAGIIAAGVTAWLIWTT